MSTPILKPRFNDTVLEAADVQARYFEYTSSANPQGSGLIGGVPFHSFPAALYAAGPTRAIALDLSKDLASDYPATAPALLASFLRVLAGEQLDLDGRVSSQVFYVISGSGQLKQDGVTLDYAEGDFLALPVGNNTHLLAQTTSTLYHVNDSPLLNYLGVQAGQPRFAATRYPAEQARKELAKVAAEGNAAKRSRISILLGNSNFPQTRTVTHVLWAMFGIVPAGAVQKAHRHQSVALDFVANCPAGCYSLVGTTLDDEGQILHPTRVDWEPGMAFVTPPGYWHAHYNTSDQAAHIIPIQDAGLLTYLRALDIRFTH